MTGLRPSVAILRGEALNPFEMQAYAPLVERMDLLAIGRHRPPYEVDLLPMPHVLLHSFGEQRLARSAHRRVRRVAKFPGDPDRLLGLAQAVRGRNILHGAETVLSTSEQAARLAPAMGARLVLTCWETIPFRYDDDPVLAGRKQIVKAVTDRYLAVTERAKNALVAEGVSADSVSVIPAAVDTERFRPGEPDPRLRERWAVPEGSLVVLYVGRLIQEKGVVELVRAFAALGADAPEAHLVFVGAGNQGERIRIAARVLGASGRVHIANAAAYSDLPEIYATADLVVTPSLSTPYWEEQFGMVLAEAMACGRPIVTTRSGAIPEVVGDAARLAEPYDVADLTSALADLLTDESARAELGRRARDRATARYAVPVVAEQLAAEYESVLAQ